MDDQILIQSSRYLDRLCYGASSRRTGSAGNQAATDYVAEVMAGFGFDVDLPSFDCIDWRHGSVSLTAESEAFEVRVSPYSLGCHVQSDLIVATSIDALAAADVEGRVLLLVGDIAREQLMPKNFIFYNPEHHRRIIALLEKKRPGAIVSATTRDPELAGGVYPFSLIEDGDFDIPCVYMTAEEGERLAKSSGRQVTLVSEAERTPSTGCNVIARRQSSVQEKVTVFAHIDAKDGTPGALDNATGVVVLMLLAEMLQRYAGGLCLELVAVNGEDYYSAPGEMQYWNDYADSFARIVLGINIDAAGYRHGKTAYSTYGCSERMTSMVRRTLEEKHGLIEGEPWYQSDHSLFIQRSRPALAVTSAKFRELSERVTHTAADTPHLVDCRKLVVIAEALRDLVLRLAT